MRQYFRRPDTSCACYLIRCHTSYRLSIMSSEIDRTWWTSWHIWPNGPGHTSTQDWSVNKYILIHWFSFIRTNGGESFTLELSIYETTERTLEFLAYLDTLRNGTNVMVNTPPPSMPPNKPTKCCCQGNVPMANTHIAINANFISAIYGRFSCFQWMKINRTVIEDITPAIDANGPT